MAESSRESGREEKGVLAVVIGKERGGESKEPFLGGSWGKEGRFCSAGANVSQNSVEPVFEERLYCLEFCPLDKKKMIQR
ncbi:Periplasmic protein TonB [Methylacidiphilum infernorum V4]|uniref:Periplasmic protein TonB n=1 Tax=Methylacidiphilum infernorum (isolate V4) TaxID=481448 RepID=B3DZX9_METI4|nr:Periplasmic protein TonB [Methylacidiphilum infernorum V4]